MPAGRYVVMRGDGTAVGTEEFRCAPGPMGWRWFSQIHTSLPTEHEEVVDLAVDAGWRPARVRIATGSHELLLTREGDRLSGWRDGAPLELDVGPQAHLEYLSPAFDAVSAMRLSGTGVIEVVSLEPVTLEPRLERRRYEDLGTAEVATPVGTFLARGWRSTALGSGLKQELWVAGDLVVRCDGHVELEWYEAGASGPRPLG